MAKSRYSDTPVVDGHHYATFRLPVLSRGYRNLDLLEGVKTVDHAWTAGDRMDKLAARYLGEDDYWWVICLANNIPYPFGIAPGMVLRVPTDTKAIFERLFR